MVLNTFAPRSAAPAPKCTSASEWDALRRFSPLWTFVSGIDAGLPGEKRDEYGVSRVRLNFVFALASQKLSLSFDVDQRIF